jgi:hypothetical protein
MSLLPETLKNPHIPFSWQQPSLYNLSTKIISHHSLKATGLEVESS